MSIEKVEQKIIQIAHDFSKRYGEEVLELEEYKLVAYIMSFLTLDEINVFRYYKTRMLYLFLKTVKEDLESSNK